MGKNRFIVLSFIVLFVCVFTVSCGGGGGGNTATNNPGGGTDNQEPDSVIVEGAYDGVATMKVWYKASPWNAAMQKTYTQNVTIKIGSPLKADDGSIEENPFNFDLKPQQVTLPGSAIIDSADYYWDMNNISTVFDYWQYSESNGHYQGEYQPHDPSLDNFNIIRAEDVTGYVPGCMAPIAPGATIDVYFYDNYLSAEIAGSVTNAFVNQLCVSYIERFELTIEEANRR